MDDVRPLLRAVERQKPEKPDKPPFRHSDRQMGACTAGKSHAEEGVEIAGLNCGQNVAQIWRE